MRLGHFVNLSLLILLGACFSYASDELSVAVEPLTLSLLEPYLQDQAGFERRVRAFEKLHIPLAQAKYREAKEFERQGNTEAAKAASDQAQDLLMRIKSAYDLGLSHFETSATLHNYYGELAHDYLARANEAAQHWQRATQLDDKHARAHNNLGMYYFHIGMYNIGLEHLEKALELEPKNQDFLFNTVQVYLTHYQQIGQIKHWDNKKIYKEAMKMSERAATSEPTDYELIRDHAFNYFLAEKFGVDPDWPRAAKLWQMARLHAKTDSERFDSWLNEARAHIRSSDKDKARECLEKARTMMPDNSVVQNLLDSLAE